MPDLMEKYARLLIEYSLNLQKDDRLLILTTYLAEPLLKEIYRHALRAGAHPEMQLGIHATKRILFETGSDEQLQYISQRLKYPIENYEAILSVMAPFDQRELEGIDPAKKQLASQARADINKTMLRRKADGKLKMSICAYPTEALAEEAGMTLAEYEDFVYSACYLDAPDAVEKWNDVREYQENICQYLNKRQKIRYLSNDVDIEFSTKDRTWINSDGTTNMPSGEVFTTPLEDSVNGKVRFSYPSIFMGQQVEDITLEVKNGEVVSWNAAKGKELLDKIFDIPGARTFGEAAVGTNDRINKFTSNILFDEKIGGTIHMAIGAAIPETGGKNESAVHWDMIADMTGGAIYADGEKVYENGKFII